MLRVVFDLAWTPRSLTAQCLDVAAERREQVVVPAFDARQLGLVHLRGGRELFLCLSGELPNLAEVHFKNLGPYVLVDFVVGHRQDEADSHAGTRGARLDRARRLS